MRTIDDAQFAQLVSGDFTDPVQLAHRQSTDEILDLIRCNDEQTVGFFPVAGDLGEKLVRRHTGRNGDVQLIRDPTTDVLGDARGATTEMRAVRHIEVGLVEGKRLDDVGVITKNRMNFLRRFSIGIHTRPDDGQVRAQLQRMPGRHG
ncbi:hypothetical protein D3C71_1398020 [compost metagenome]